MKGNKKKISRRVAPRQVGRMVETVIGCKWSLTVLDLVARDILRPGEMERSIEGLTAKVLNDCLRRLVQFRVLEKRSYPEIPPRVEYGFTEFGRKFQTTLDALDTLEAAFEAAKAGTAETGRMATPSCRGTQTWMGNDRACTHQAPCSNSRSLPKTQVLPVRSAEGSLNCSYRRFV